MCPFAPIFLGNNCFRVKYLESTLSFDIYLGTIWKEATAAKESIEILTGWWNDVLQIISQGNNCFRVTYLESTFTYDIYLGTSWKEATAAKESKEILKGKWKDAPQIFGTSWISCGSVVLVNENIWVIFAPWSCCWLDDDLGALFVDVVDGEIDQQLIFRFLN